MDTFLAILPYAGSERERLKLGALKRPEESDKTQRSRVPGEETKRGFQVAQKRKPWGV